MSCDITAVDLARPALEVTSLIPSISIIPIDCQDVTASVIYAPDTGETLFALIPGPRGAGGSSTSDPPTEFIAMTPGPQSIPTTATCVTLYCNGLLVQTAHFIVSAGVLNTPPSYPVEAGDVFSLFSC